MSTTTLNSGHTDYSSIPPMATKPDDSSLTNLLSLPPEVMEAVTDELPDESLLSLRLVCRDIENKTLRWYEQRCLSGKSFVIGSPSSMMHLQSISQSRFSRMLTRVNLVLQEIEYSTKGAEAGWRRWAAETKSGNTTLNPEQKAEYLGLRRTYNDMLNQQRDFVLRAFYDILTNSLKNLATRGVDEIVVTITNERHENPVAPPEFHRLQRILGLGIHLTDIKQCCDHHLTQILKCVLKADCRVRKLVVLKRAMVASPYVFHDLGCGRKQKKPLTEHCSSILRVLDMTLSDICSVEASLTNSMLGLHKFLTHSPRLAVLKLHCQEPPLSLVLKWHENGVRTGLNSLSELFFQLCLPSLKHADLRLPLPADSDIVTFIRRHRSTLQKFILYKSWMKLAVATTIAIDEAKLALEAEANGFELQIVDDKKNY